MPTASELQIHIALVHRLRLQCRPGVKFWHTANGEKRSPRDAAKLRAMGVLAGVPDLIFVWSEAGGNFGPFPKILFLEIKKVGGRLSPAQSEFGTWCAWNNIPWFTTDNVDDAVLILRHHGILPPEGQIWNERANKYGELA